MRFSLRTLIECVQKKLISASNLLERRSQARRAFLKEVQQELFWGQPLDFRRLEPRRVLDASFELVGGNLSLFDFAAATNLTVAYNSGTSSYVFSLTTGTWTDPSLAPPLDDTGLSTLTIAQASLTGNLNITSFAPSTGVLFDGNFTAAANPIDNVTVSTNGAVSNNAGTQWNFATFQVTNSGSIDLGGDVTDNLNFGTLNFNSVGNVSITEQSDMTVVGVNTALDAKLTAVSASSDLAINGTITAADDILLVVGRNLSQSAAITADGLGLDVDGLTTLTNPANNVNSIAANNGGLTRYTDTNTVAIDSVTVDAITVSGITTSDDDVNLTVNTGDLAINQAVSLGTGDLLLDVTGNVTQTASISGDGLGLVVDGTTVLTNAANNMATIAANNGGETEFVDSNTLNVGTVTAAGVTVTGISTSNDDVKLTVNIGNLDIDQAIALGTGDLLFDVTGNVVQTAVITAGGLGLMVDGTTTLNNAANNVTTIAANNGGETQYTDANSLAVGAVTVAGMTVTGITTTNDDVKLTVNAGNLDIDQAVALGTGDLLLDVTGNVAQTAAITAGGLGLMVDGTTTLNNAANDVTTIAVSNGDETQYTDANALEVGTVTVAGMTVTGITTTNDDVKLTVNAGNLDINQAVALGTGDLFLDVTGNVAQTATITAGGLGLMVDGTTTLNNAANNVATIAADNGGETQYTDANALAVGIVTVAGMTVTGITTSNDDVKLTVNTGNLDINQAVALGTGDLFLDVTGNVAQAAAIAAGGLGLMVDGTTTLNNAANNVTTFAADNGGETQYTDANALTVGTVTVAGMTVTGVRTTNDDVKLTVNIGNLDINQAIVLGTGNLFLDVTGNVAQTAAVTASGLGLMVDGTTTLNDAANNVTTIAANNGGETQYTDANTLTVGTVTVSGMTVTGITTTDDNVKLTVNIGDLAINQAVALGTGNLFLDVAGNVTQTAAITAGGLGLMVDGLTTLNNAANNVTTLAADNGGVTQYTDANGLAVGTVTVAGMTVTGIATSNDDVKLTVNIGDLAINQAITLGTGKLFLDVTGNVTQTAAITAGELGLMVDGLTTLTNAANNVATIAADNGGETQYTDANALAVGIVTVAGMTVTGIRTTNDDVKLTVNIGDLAINQAIALGTGNLFLDVAGDVTQTAAITAGGLGLMVDGITTLNNAANNVTTIAANNGGETQYTDANALTVGTVTVAGMTVTGITTTDDNVKLTVNIGDLAINQAIALGTGNLLLDVAGSVTQTAAITAGGLGLMVDGNTTLNNAANNVTTIAANNGGDTQYTDANGLAVGTVTVAGMTVTGITTTNDAVKLTVDAGDLAITQAIALGAGNLFLDVTGNVTQTAAITAGGLGLMVDGTTTLNNAANNVTTIAADNSGETQYTDANTLTVGTVTVAGMTVTGITTTDDNVKLTVNIGNLAINQAITLGAGNLFLDVAGNVTQAVAITANGLGLMVDGTTTLTNVDNNVATIAADNRGETLYTDANTLAVGTVTVAGMTVTGIRTADDDVKLTVIIGNLDINQAVALGTGDLFLDITGNVNQTAAITAGGLGLMVDGNTTLNNAGNNVVTLAAANGGFIVYTNVGDLNIGAVTVAGMTVEDVVTPADITITAQSIIDADIVDADPIDYDIDGATLTLTATSGSIGSSTGDPLCDGVFNLLEVRASGNLFANAPNGFVALDAAVTGTSTIVALSGVLQSNGDVNATGLDASLTTNLYLIADADRDGIGNLIINSPLSVAGDLRLQGADIISAGPLVLRADRILFVSGSVESIAVSDSLLNPNGVPLILDARATDLTVTATGNIQLQDLDCDNVALASTTVAGNVLLTSTGSVTVLDDVIAGFDGAATTSTGNIQISAAVNLLVHDAIVSDAGNIVLRADNDVRISLLPVPEVDDLVVVTSSTGTIAISADFNNDNNGNGGELFMSDRARVIAGRANVDYVPGTDGIASPTIISLANTARPGATVTLSADENITIGSLQSADNTGAAIQVTSRNAGIVDGGDTDLDFVANFTGALTTLRTVAGTGNGNALETAIYAVDTTNTAGTVNAASGDICINEVLAGGDLRVVNANNAAGAVEIQVDAGTLTVLGLGVTTTTGNILLKASQDVVIDAVVTAINSGHITLDAGDDVDVNFAVQTDGSGDIYIEARNAANDTIAPEVNGINIDATVSANNGSILLRSNQDIRTTANLDGLRVGLTAGRDVLQNSNILATTGDVAVVATSGNFTMSTGTSISALAGNIVATTGGSIALGLLTASNVGLSAGGSITDANGAGVLNVVSNNLSMRSASGIGAAAAPIDTSVVTLAAIASNIGADIFINETDGLIVGLVAITSSIANASRVNFKAALSNESLAATVTPVSGITTNNGDAKLTVGGNLDIDRAIALGTGNLFLDVTGDVTQAAAITAGALGLMVDGATMLTNVANNVATIAADNRGQTIYTDADTLTVGSVTVASMTVTGITTTNDDVTLTVLANDLRIAQAINVGTGSLLLDVAGNVTQTGDANNVGAGIITANGLALVVDGATMLTNTQNNVVTLAALNGDQTMYTDANGLTVGTVNISALTLNGVTVPAVSVTGVSTTNDDVTLTVLANDLRIAQAINVGTGSLLLDVAGDVTQTGDATTAGAGIITANGLALVVDGATMLTNTLNNVATLAANNGGQTMYTDANGLTVGTVNISALTLSGVTVPAVSVTGITTTNDDVTLTVLANDLRIAQAINVGTGNLLLDVAGNVTQAGDANNAGAGVITANGLALVVDGATMLTNTLNNVAILAANNGGQTMYTDANGLTVGTVDISALTLSGVTVAAVSVAGITTTDDDVTLTVLANDLRIAQAINVGTGNLLLDVTGNVTQTGDANNAGAGVITANGLALVVDGATMLTNTLNNVVTLAANNGGQTMYTDANGLTVGTVNISALTLNGVTVAAVSVTGITTTNDDVTLTVLANDLRIAQAINVGTGRLLLDVAGNVTQAGDANNPGAGVITANGLALVVDGATMLTNTQNNVATLAANNGGQTMYTDANGLTVGTVNISALTLSGVTVPAVSVTGVTTSNDDVTLTILANDLRIAQAINVGTGSLLLDVAGNVTQTGDANNAGAGVITANGLALVVDGATMLTNTQNNVVTLAAINGGQTMYTDADGLTVGTVDISALTLNGVTVAAVSVTGITTTNDDVTLTVLANDLRIAQAINVGTGSLLLDVAGNVTQTGDANNAGAGVITANGLALVVDGATMLTNTLNNVATLAANNGGQTMYTDVNGLSVGTVNISALTLNGVTVAAVSVTGITTTNDDVTLTVVANDLRIAQAINIGTGSLLLDVAGNVTQAGDANNAGAGVITANGLALVVDGATMLTNTLNNVATLAANNGGQTMYTDANGLTVGTVDISALTLSGVTVAAVSVAGITTTDDDVTLTVLANDLRIAQAINVGTGSLLLDVSGDVTQTGDANNAGAGVITANGLALVVDGATMLTNTQNNVATLAANNGGQTMYTDANGLTVGTVNISALTLNGVTVAAVSVTGITTSNDDVTLTVLANDLRIAQAINVGTGNLLLDVAGNVTQAGDANNAGAGVITANGLALVVDGATMLTNTQNNVATLAANNGGQTMYTDANGLTVGTVNISALTLSGVTVAAVSVTGVTTSNDDVTLTVLANDLRIAQAINVGTGSLLLDATGNVTQAGDANNAGAGVITANGLALVVDGATMLTNTQNNVATLAANNGGQTMYTDANGLTVGTVNISALTLNGVTVPAVTVTGITTTNDDVTLTVLASDLRIAQAINVGTGSLLLDVAGNVTQTGDANNAGAGVITANGLALVVDGATMLTNTQNNVATLAANNGGQTMYTDANGLTVGTVNISALTLNGVTVAAVSVTGVTTTNDDVTLTVLANDLRIAQAINVGAASLLLDVAGNVTQTGDANNAGAGVITANGLGLVVDGATMLTNTQNNVATLAANNGGQTMYTDANGLTVGTVNISALTLSGVTVPAVSVTGITTSNDDVTLTVLANDLRIAQAINVGTGSLLLDVTGDVTQAGDANNAGAGVITANGLALVVDGATMLTNTLNNVATLAANNGGQTMYTDANDLTVGTVSISALTLNGVTVPAVTVTGITTTNDDVTLTVIANDLRIAQAINVGTGSLLLDVAGNVTQTGDANNAGAGIITADGLALVVDGATMLTNRQNNVATLAANNGGQTMYTDANGLTVGTVNISALTLNGVTVSAVTVTGVTTTNDDVTLTVLANDLRIAQAINLGTGSLLLDVTGNVTQAGDANNAGAGIITANGLGLVVDGATMLTNTQNNVATLAANNQGQTMYTDANGLTVGTVNISALTLNGVTVAAVSVAGITTTDDDVTLTVLANDLRIAQAINVGTGSLLLDVTGNVTQTGDANNAGAGIITANGLALVVDGATMLTNTQNNVATLAANNGGQTMYTDANGLTVGTVNISALTLNGVTVPAVTVTGITTTNDDVTLTVLANDLRIAEAINVGTGNLLLDVTGDVTQAGDANNAGAGVITANGLALVVDGATMLTNTQNNVATFAANNGGQTMYTDANGLTVGTVNISALTLNGVTVPAVTVTGIATTNDDVTLTVLANDLRIAQAINVGTGSLLLDVTGNVTQAGDANNAGAGIITANGLGLVVDGATMLTNTQNNVVTLAANNGGQTMYTDADGLTVGTVSISALTLNGVTVAAVSVTGVTTTNDDVTLTVLANDLRIAQAINVGTGSLLLDVTGNVTQAGDANNAGAGIITANGLALLVVGATMLTNSQNNVVTLAANNGGQTMYTDANDLTVGTVSISALTLNGVTVSAVNVTGITTTNDVTLTVLANDLRIAQAINVGTGSLLLDVARNVTQAGDANNAGAGIITADGLGLRVKGATMLTNTQNNVVTLAANNGGQTMYTDANGLTVGTVDISALTLNGVTVPAVIDTGITTTNDDVTLTVLANDLRIAQAINVGTGNLLLDVTGDVTQAGAGVITANGLALVVDGATMLTNTQNNVVTLAANNGGQTMYTDANGLTVGTVDISALTLNGVTVPAVSVTGITTTDDNVNLTILLNDLVVNQTIKTGSGAVDLTTTTGHIESLSGLGNSVAVIGNQLTLKAGTYAFLRTQVNELTSISVVSNGSLKDVSLNKGASDNGVNFLEKLKTGIATPPTFEKSQLEKYQYRERFGTIDDRKSALYIRNDGDLIVKNVTAKDLSITTTTSPNIYIETTHQFKLTIDGTVTSSSKNPSVGVIVLIAGGTLSQENAMIVTETALVMNLRNLNSKFYMGGEGPSITSSQFVYGTYDELNTYETRPPENDGLDKSNDFYQRVVLQFGGTGEEGFLSIVAYADGEISETKVFVTDRGGDFVDRKILFANDFLADNPILLTNAIIRRADSIFLFSGGGENDLTFVASPITNVNSQGTPGGGYVSPEPDIPAPQPFNAPVINAVLPILTEPPLPQVELPAQLTKSTDVAIYRIDFEGIDANENGQVEQSELPTYEIVLEKGVDDESKKTRSIIESKTGGKTPTQDDIDREKNLLQNNPNQPAGVYAIIKTDAEGNQTVLDVFSVRDWPEKQTAETDEGDEVKVPKLEPFSPDSPKGSTEGEVVPAPVAEPKDSDSSLFVPVEESGPRQESRFASAGLLLGSLWMLRTSHSKVNQETLEDTLQAKAAVDYGRQARRRRQRAK